MPTMRSNGYTNWNTNGNQARRQSMAGYLVYSRCAKWVLTMARLMRRADVDVVKQLDGLNDYDLVAVALTIGVDVECYEVFDVEDMDKLNNDGTATLQ